MSALLFSITRRISAIRPTGMQGATVYLPRILSGRESSRAIGARMGATRFRQAGRSPSATEFSSTMGTTGKPRWRTLTGSTQQRNRRSHAKRSGCHTARFSQDNRENHGGPCCARSEEHTSELQSLAYLVCRLLLEKKKKSSYIHAT